MGGMKRCPNCHYYMFMEIDYSNAIPDVYHYCRNCGFTDKEQNESYGYYTNFIKNKVINNNKTE